MKALKSLLSIAIILSSLFSYSQQSQKDSLVHKFDELVTYIDQLYVDDVDKKKIVDKAIISMLDELDPHSVYIPSDEVQRSNERIVGSFVGIGVRFQIYKDTLLVIHPTPGGPSHKLGILPGDKIIKIDKETIAGTGLKNSGVRKRLLGDKGTVVRVSILRKGEKRLIDFDITRDKIPLYSVVAKYMADDETGYIKLTSFSRTSHAEIKQAVAELKLKGMKNLVIDLQNNGGGLLWSAKNISDELLSEDKLIVYSEGRAQPRRDLNAGDHLTKGVWEEGKLVVLINEHSASASEIVSGAIQDWDRGLIVGRRSFGKGLVQRPIDLSDGSQIRLTIARYFTPAGRFIQKSYEDKEAYENDYLNRYLNGELSSKDSIDLPDSLLHHTLITKREVYGGGGIMPDYFVPIDTTGISDLYKDINRKGLINSFTVAHINSNRKSLKETYPDLASFKTDFSITKSFFDKFLKKVKDAEIEITDADMKESKSLIKLRIKAGLAQNLYEDASYYEIMNVENSALVEALRLLKSKKYDASNLAKH
jgi:carboxyl-terminal processing protease